MVLGHFSDSYPEIIEIITLESRTDNYKVASEILAFSGFELRKVWLMLEHGVLGMHCFWVFSVSVDDEFWSEFLNFVAKNKQPDLIRVRNRRVQCAVWGHFTFSSWYYWWLILQFMMFFSVFLKKSFLKNINWNAMFCAFLCNIDFLVSPLCWDCLNRSVGIYWFSFWSDRLDGFWT